MGGEPTFVSIDDPDGAEWNFTAVCTRSASVWRVAETLRQRLRPVRCCITGRENGIRANSATLGAAAYWRKDGVPIWSNDSSSLMNRRITVHGAKEARALVLRIAHTLDAEAKCLLSRLRGTPSTHLKERRCHPT